MKFRVALYCLLGGVPLLVPALTLGHMFWWYVSGVILAAVRDGHHCWNVVSSDIVRHVSLW